MAERVASLAAGLLQDGIEHLHDEALLSTRQLLNALDLLLQLRCRSALLGRADFIPEQLFQGHPERAGKARQRRDRKPARWGMTS